MAFYLGKPKTWVSITLCSLFIYTLYWLIITTRYVWEVYSRPGGPIDPYFYRITGFAGIIMRFLGVSLALLSMYLFWRHKGNPVPYVKGKISTALLFEAFYYLSFTPFVIVYIDSNPFFAVNYLLQILLISPFLINLGLKVKFDTGDSIKKGLLKSIGIAGVGYIAAIWVNNVSRWLDMTSRFGIQFLSTGITFLGFVNTIFTLSLSVVFALAGFSLLPKKRNIATKWWGLSLIMLGVHFVIYLLHSAYVGALDFALLNEIWTVSLLGLGLSILKQKTH